MKTLEELFYVGLKFHGHKCPAMPMGLRAGMAAMRVLGVERSQDKELFLESETGKTHAAGCFLDGLMTATSCTYGKSNIQKLYYNKMAFTLTEVATGRSVRVSLKPGFLEQSVQSPFVQKRKEGIPPQLIPTEITEPLINRILSLPEEQFLEIGEVIVRAMPPKQKGCFEVKRCGTCGEAVFADKLTEKNDGSALCIPCGAKA